jgi:hypothetical protein
MRNAPLVYMWIAQYIDGTIVPQFDFETGEESLFKNLDQTKIDKFSLFPISQTLFPKINQKQGWDATVSKTTLPYFILKLQPNQRLIYIRRNFIREFSYKICTKCGYKWMYMPNHKEEMSEVKLRMHQNSVTQMENGQPVQIPSCPKCGAFNKIICDCGGLINKMQNASKVFYYECPVCKRQHPRVIISTDGTQAEVKYLLGYQITIDNQNTKHIMYINENGEIELGE